MVTSIMLTGMYNIGISSNNKIQTPEGVIVDLQDIPFIRYRFDRYGEEELKFIANNKKKFPCVHLVEINIGSDTPDIISKIEYISENIAIMLYVDITDEVVDNKAFSDEVTEWMEDVADCRFDRLNLRDKSTKLFNSDLDIIKKEAASIMGLRAKDIGLCGGPLCFMEGNACLTAVKAREILANYADRDDVVVPSANHEAKLGANEGKDYLNSCGCIRYHIFNSDMEAPVTKSIGKVTRVSKKVKVSTPDGDKEIEVTEKTSKSTNEPKEQKPKVPKLKGYIPVKW